MSSNRAHQALDFLKNELPHWEDMLQYLENEDGAEFVRQKFDNQEIDIDVTNYKIKLGRCKNRDSNTGKVEECVYQDFDVNSFYDPKRTHKKNVKSMQNTCLPYKKWVFKKLIPIDCSEIIETEEIDSPMSSFCETNSHSRNNQDEFFTASTQYAKNSNILLKSPAYCKRSAAEWKVRDSILTWYTIKAQNVLNDLNSYRKSNSNYDSSRNRHSHSTKSNTFRVSLQKPSDMPFKVVNNDEHSPTSSTPFREIKSLHKAKPKRNRRTREERNVKSFGQKIFFNSGKPKLNNVNKKNIQSVTVYQGSLTFNDSPIKVGKAAKANMFWSFENNGTALQQQRIDPLRRSCGVNQNRYFKSSGIVERPLKIFKANSVLPGTSNLIISQDIESNTLLNSPKTVRSPISISNRSSWIRSKLTESARISFTSTVPNSNNPYGKTRNSLQKNYKNSGISLTTEAQSLALKILTPNPKGKVKKIVRMAQVDLGRESEKTFKHDGKRHIVKMQATMGCDIKKSGSSKSEKAARKRRGWN
jgi:hypothetical protein